MITRLDNCPPTGTTKPRISGVLSLRGLIRVRNLFVEGFEPLNEAISKLYISNIFGIPGNGHKVWIEYEGLLYGSVTQ